MSNRTTITAATLVPDMDGSNEVHCSLSDGTEVILVLHGATEARWPRGCMNVRLPDSLSMDLEILRRRLT